MPRDHAARTHTSTAAPEEGGAVMTIVGGMTPVTGAGDGGVGRELLVADPGPASLPPAVGRPAGGRWWGGRG
jgi:hypothetical protein